MVDTMKIQFPGLTEAQSGNTMLFLELVADTRRTGCQCLVMRRNILTRDTYKMYRDPYDGKLHAVIRNGQRVISGRKGIDWCKPAIYEVASGCQLMVYHKYCYSQKRRPLKIWWDPEKKEFVKYRETEYIAPMRPPLYETVMRSNEGRIYMFLPVLVRWHPLIRYEYTEQGVEYPALHQYSTDDVYFARCVWVDIDGHSLPLDEIMELNPQAVDRLMELLPGYCLETQIPMPAVVNSGRGVHLYWWLDAAVNIRDREPQEMFRRLLCAMNAWAAELIGRDPLCSRVWEADSSTAAVFHLMNLPGCVHPKTGKRRYVVNRYGTDYHRCSYDDLCEAMGIRETEPSAVEAATIPEDTAVPELQEKPAPLPCPVHAVPKCCNPRVGKLLHWAERRRWDLYPGRRLFLLCVGIVHQCGADFDLTDPANYPLYEINRKLLEPLDTREVDEVMKSLIDKAKTGVPYHIRDTMVAEKLKMTDEEREWFCTSVAKPVPIQTTYPTFHSKLVEIMDQTQWELEHELFTEYMDRCYHMTIQWFNENRFDQNRNSARTRKRRAKAGYTGHAGRPAMYGEEEQAACRALREQGLSFRRIAEQTKLSEATVRRLLKKRDASQSDDCIT